MALRRPWDWLDALSLGVMLLHLLAAPYTKVEESFNMQAMHDVLHHGPALSSYDHHAFPGVVPRTFTGAIAVSGLAFPFHALARAVSLPRVASQYAVRAVLGAASVGASSQLRSAIAARFGADAGVAFVAVSLSQFHLPFYWSRSLPNTFALVMTTLGFAAWVSGHAHGEVPASEQPRCVAALRTSIGWLTAAAVVFRCDVVILLAFCCALSLVVRPRLGVLQLLTTGLRWGLSALAITVCVDSLMWGRPIWPELEVFLFNTVENRSSEWGVSAWHWYFSRALPKALLPAALLFLLAGLRYEGARLAPLLTPATLFVRSALYSCAALSAHPLAPFHPANAFINAPFCRSYVEKGLVASTPGGGGGGGAGRLADSNPTLKLLPPQVCAYSFLPHKELRFIFHAIPPLNTAAALGLAHIYRRHRAAAAAKTGAWPYAWLPHLVWLGSVLLVAGACCRTQQPQRADRSVRPLFTHSCPAALDLELTPRHGVTARHRVQVVRCCPRCSCGPRPTTTPAETVRGRISPHLPGHPPVPGPACAPLCDV